MEAFMDDLWVMISDLLHRLQSIMDSLLSPLYVLGPVFIITILAILTVIITKQLNKIIITKRYVELEKEFKYWFNLREEALKGPDNEKAKRLARNIDQAKLNRAYYDYFLEGFLLGLARNVMPIFFMVAYINESFRPEKLSALFGKPYLFVLPSFGKEPVMVGSVFYYICVLMFCYLAWSVFKMFIKGRTFIKKQKESICKT